jgi:acyl carrier protein
MKTLEEFVELFAEQFDDTDASEFTPQTVFHDLDEWSSLVGLSVIAMIDEEFDAVIKGDEMRSAVTIEDLYNIVVNKV